MIDRLIALLAPHRCLSCHHPGALLCMACRLDEQLMHEPVCIGCGKYDDRGVCGDCATEWPVDRACVFSERSGVVKTLIDEFKYGPKRAAYTDMAALAVSTLPLVVGAVVIPIPTIARHIRERGFDHASLVARKIAKSHRMAYAPLLRRSGTSVQHTASKKDRITQAAGAFTVKGTLDPDVLYIIYDDIVTTGASMKAAAAVLRVAGATRVWAVAVARQPLDVM